ncbi:MAG: hypothetical protein JST27_04575, partial [Bacteroidetes bacterium]|nr:hypothetical protein [Bacteroidota bacterium]
ETTYNYEVARTNDSAQTEYHGFSFEVPVTNDSLLSEADVSDYMYQIKDSMMVAWDSIAYEAKDLSLFDLEIEHTSGEANATFTVHYSITSGDPIVWDPTVSKTIYGDATGWAAQIPPCGVTYTYMYPGLPNYQNPYFKGVGTLHYATNSISAVSCSQPGAAVILRAYGINNYFAAYGSPSRIYLHINIKLGTVQLPNAVTIHHDYYNRGYLYYRNDDQYYVWVPANQMNGNPDYSGNYFYAQWPNESMMNFYLGYIPTKIHNSVPTGKYLQDFQIIMMNQLTSGWDMQHWYQIFYSDLTDLPVNDHNTKLPHF